MNDLVQIPPRFLTANSTRTRALKSQCLLLALALSATASAGRSQGFAGLSNYATAPFTGAAVVTNGHFTNVYLFPDPNTETWDQHLRSIGSSNQSFATTEIIDAFTRSLTSSNYFFKLHQYVAGFGGNGGGINPPTFLGDARTIQQCVDAAIRDTTPDPNPDPSLNIKTGMTISYGTLRTFAGCEQSLGGNRSDQVNLILSPEFNPAGWGSSTGICGTSTDGYHGFGLNVPNFTVIPTNSRCVSALAPLTETISHEMVETLTDPAGLGYIHEFNPARVLGDSGAWANQYNRGELGDICELGGPQNPGRMQSIAYSTFAGGAISKYWSNNDEACVAGCPVIPSPAPAHPLAGSIHILKARIGCLDLQKDGNLTALVAAKCDNKYNCVYQAPTPRDYTMACVLAATRTACTQAMEIIFQCGLGAPQVLTVPGDAWNQPPATISCATPPQPVPAGTPVITVTKARIGCLDIQTSGNLTSVVANACNNHEFCDFKAPTPDQYARMGVTAATRTFCSQAMEITFQCQNTRSTVITVPGDAWNQPPAFLHCNVSHNIQ